MSKIAKGFKPSIVAAPEPSKGSEFKVTHVEKLPANLPSDMHERLELIGSLQIKNVLGR